MKKHYIYICKDYFRTTKRTFKLIQLYKIHVALWPYIAGITSFIDLHLQEDNGLPVHIKGGSIDVLLYRLTMTITIAGTKPFWSIMKT